MSSDFLYKQIENSGHTFCNQQIEKCIVDFLQEELEVVKRKEIRLIQLLLKDVLSNILDEFEISTLLEDNDIKIIVNNKLDKSLIIKIKTI